MDGRVARPHTSISTGILELRSDGQARAAKVKEQGQRQRAGVPAPHEHSTLWTFHTTSVPHFLVVAGEADPVFHLIEVVGEGAAAGGGEAVFGAGEAGFEIFQAGNVFGLFELAGMDAQVSVGGFEDAFEVGETEARVGGESADDPQANAFVNEAVELGELECGRGSTFAGQGRGFHGLAALGL